jgi:RNA polymerase sigma-70 factor (ECF subfamily)
MAPPANAAATTEDDSRLMARVRTGDEAALGELMGRWERPVKAVIGRIVLNTRDADELAQETFVRLWDQRSRFRDGAPFRPWVFAIAVNLARNRLRWWRRRPEIALEEWTEAPAGTGHGADAAERTERAHAVQMAIAALPTDLREALVLAEYENLSHAEIASIAGTTAKAVESRLARARAKLRTSLAAWLT